MKETELNRVDYFKRSQREGIFHFIKVFGGPGKTRNGYQEVINFLNQVPLIYIERNFETDTSGLTGTWCNWEVGEPIRREEYEAAYRLATAGEFKVI